MARCHKCGKVCDTTYVSNSKHFCKACWDKLPSGGGDPLNDLVLSVFVSIILPIIGIVAIFMLCRFAVVFASEKFGLPQEMCGYVWLGASSVLSLPFVIIALRGLWMTWCEMHWILKTFFCVCCPPLIILLIIEWLIKRFSKR